MNKSIISKRKKANRFSILFLLFFVSCGSLLIHRAHLTTSNLMKVNGVLNSFEISNGFGNEGKNAAILFHIEGVHNTYGLYAGTKNQAETKKNNLNLIPGNQYSFFIDKSVIATFNEINLGVKIIKNGDEVIFQENKKPLLFFGIIFILMGILSSLLFYFLGKKYF